MQRSTDVERGMHALQDYHTTCIRIPSVDRNNLQMRREVAEMIRAIREEAMRLGIELTVTIVSLAADDPCNHSSIYPKTVITYLHLVRKGKIGPHDIISRSLSIEDRTRGILQSVYCALRERDAGKADSQPKREDVTLVTDDLVEVTIPFFSKEHAFGDFHRLLQKWSRSILKDRQLVYIGTSLDAQGISKSRFGIRSCGTFLNENSVSGKNWLGDKGDYDGWLQ